VKKILIYIAIFYTTIFSQTADSTKAERLLKIYRNLEYNTLAFNDLKSTWDITDPILIRDIFNRCIVVNALKINGKKPTLEEIKERAYDIYDGKVFIELRKRYFDNEIELMRFYTESKFDSTKEDYFFDEIQDNVQIRKVLGTNIYEDIKSQFYALNDLTKTYYDNKDAYSFDVNLQMFRPELMFYSITTVNKNKFLLSFTGKWGEDYIVQPGWYSPHYIISSKITFIDRITNFNPHKTYSFEVGVGVTTHQPNLGNSIVNNQFYSSGIPIYFSFNGNPLTLFSKNYNLEKFNFGLSFALALTQFQTSDYDVDYLSKFYSNRNYFTVMAEYKNFYHFMDIGWLNAAAVISGYDVYSYFLNPKYKELLLIDDKFNYNLNLETYLSNPTGLLSYKAGALVNFNFSEGTSYLGIKTLFMITNRFGVDFRFFTGFAFSGDLPYYRNSTYLLVSPIIRINY